MRKLFRPLVRLPAVIFPKQPLSLTAIKAADYGGVPSEDQPFAIDELMLQQAWVRHEGCLAAFGPGSRVGVIMHVMYDHVLEAAEPTPPGVAHAVGADRVRLVRTLNPSSAESEGGCALCELSELHDEELSAARQERLDDEAEAALRLVELGQERGVFSLESSALDEELGGANVCDPRCHPLWPLESELPSADLPGVDLSLWLAARLPFTTELRIQLLSTLCPLRRMQDVVDALRLLCDPHRARSSPHKFKLILSHAANDAFCSTIGGAVQAPRAVVAIAPPSFTNWSSTDAFPHG